MEETCGRDDSNCNAFDDPPGGMIFNVNKRGVPDNLEDVRGKDDSVSAGVAEEDEYDGVGASSEKLRYWVEVLQLQAISLAL